MAVGPLSRYSSKDATIAVSGDGEERVVLPARWHAPASVDVAYHVVEEGDSFETLAHRHLGSSELWWRIADVNPLIFPLSLEIGSTVLIPIGGARPGPSRTRSW